MKDKECGIAVGNFDGVHQGHRLVINTLRTECAKRAITPIAITFDNHPLKLLAPSRAPKILTDTAEKLSLLSDLGVETALLHFDEALRHLSAYEFMQMLKERYNARLLLVGHDNRFGNNSHHLSQQEAMDSYRRYGTELGIEVLEAPMLDGVSSSVVRALIEQGDVAKAAQWLTTPYRWSGTVVDGKHLGRTIGFPTVNLRATDSDKITPRGGVYAADITLPDGSCHRAMVNIGTCPTVTDASVPSVTIEAHIIDYTGDLYGSTLTLHFLRRLRDERKFPSVEELCHQLREDKRNAMS
jgi:riboflavin kinase/FMN adenylyltransferase